MFENAGRFLPSLYLPHAKNCQYWQELFYCEKGIFGVSEGDVSPGCHQYSCCVFLK